MTKTYNIRFERTTGQNPFCGSPCTTAEDVTISIAAGDETALLEKFGAHIAEHGFELTRINRIEKISECGATAPILEVFQMFIDKGKRD